MHGEKCPSSWAFISGSPPAARQTTRSGGSANSKSLEGLIDGRPSSYCTIPPLGRTSLDLMGGAQRASGAHWHSKAARRKSRVQSANQYIHQECDGKGSAPNPVIKVGVCPPCRAAKKGHDARRVLWLARAAPEFRMLSIPYRMPYVEQEKNTSRQRAKRKEGKWHAPPFEPRRIPSQPTTITRAVVTHAL